MRGWVKGFFEKQHAFSTLCRKVHYLLHSELPSQAVSRTDMAVRILCTSLSPPPHPLTSQTVLVLLAELAVNAPS